MAVSKERIDYLINHLNLKDLELVTDLMERLVQNNPPSDVPIDDEPTTDADIQAIKAAHEAMNNGELINLEDIEHELRN
ncbi:hypothetical protein [Paenibacillus aquistagni]|uniref:hypothetical protein n=1 Tax=Paenibacillus aquistagni TaxID=1852522 RepID=UPI00145A74EA|nr:hypothetical protein [Paenibacillus aquistagni]NMM53965.1 hypothetical protein [Paenibacillus aquistagni]